MTREKFNRQLLLCLKAEDTEDGLTKARQWFEFNGLESHSAAIHKKTKSLLRARGRNQAMRIIWNSPSTFGGIGDVYNAFIPSLTLGCGSCGRNSVGDNVSAINL